MAVEQVSDGMRSPQRNRQLAARAFHGTVSACLVVLMEPENKGQAGCPGLPTDSRGSHIGWPVL